MSPTIEPKATRAISVVVPSHDRPVRLRWLLNALEDQTLDTERWEVIVAHDSPDPEVRKLLRTHPLATAGVLREVALPRSASPAAKRNAAWQEAQAPLVAFTHDDCRPPRAWLQQATAAAREQPGAIVEGMTRPDPWEETLVRAAPYARTHFLRPPNPWAVACNILYPREVLERNGGFDESLPPAGGDDTDLALRAQRSGERHVGAPEVVMYHSVEPISLATRLFRTWRRRHLAQIVKRHPPLRRHFPLRIFWKRTHAWLPLAVAGALLVRRRGPFGLLAVPWLLHAFPRYGQHPRGRLRSLVELPGRATLDFVEVGVLLVGSVRYRTLFL